jgi:tetratricopeptide (TPR) repeat protein
MQVSNRHTLPVVLALAVGVMTAGCDEAPDAVSAYTPDDTYDLGLTDPTYYINLGKELRSNRKPEAAIGAYRKAIQIDFNSAEAYHELGDLLSEQRRPEEALAAYRRAIQVNAKDADAFRGLGNALFDQKRPEEAIAAYRRAIQVNPKNAAAYAGLGNALMEQRKLSDAIETYQQALALAENSGGDSDSYSDSNLDKHSNKYAENSVSAHTLALVGLGRALQAQQRLDDAIVLYRRAIRLSPDYALTYVFLGHALTEQKQFNEANNNYHQALTRPNLKKLRLGDSHALAHNGLGMVLQRQGKLQAAIQEYEQAVSIDLSYETGHKNLKGAKQWLMKQARQKPESSRA